MTDGLSMFPDMKDVEKPDTRYRRKVKAALEFYSARGLTLKHISDKKIMNRTVAVLKRHARIHGLSFPDYKPRKNKTNESDGRAG